MKKKKSGLQCPIIDLPKIEATPCKDQMPYQPDQIIEIPKTAKVDGGQIDWHCNGHDYTMYINGIDAAQVETLKKEIAAGGFKLKFTQL